MHTIPGGDWDYIWELENVPKFISRELAEHLLILLLILVDGAQIYVFNSQTSSPWSLARTDRASRLSSVPANDRRAVTGF